MSRVNSGALQVRILSVSSKVFGCTDAHISYKYGGGDFILVKNGKLFFKYGVRFYLKNFNSIEDVDKFLENNIKTIEGICQ